MSARAHLSRNDYWDDHASQELFPGEPILPRPRRRSTMLRAALVLTLLFGGGYAAVQTKDIWQPWLPSDLSALKSLLTTSAPGPADRKAADASLPPQPLAAREIAEAPRIDAGTPVANRPADVTTLNTAAPDAGAADEEATSNERPLPLPPLTVDASDPNQKRALAAGLHPGLSRALLAGMSDADYRNAAHAIKTALAETRDGEVFLWPKKGTPKDAVFEVKFVKSASPDCRRYVVTIGKDRWATTARPMEKCGLKAPGKRSAAASPRPASQ